jgi:hypothetical protein
MTAETETENNENQHDVNQNDVNQGCVTRVRRYGDGVMTANKCAGRGLVA